MVAEYATPKNNYMFTLYSIHTVYSKVPEKPDFE